jgi:hypothetical protein
MGYALTRTVLLPETCADSCAPQRGRTSAACEPCSSFDDMLTDPLSHELQPLRSRYSMRPAKSGPRMNDAGSSWGSGEFLDSMTAAHADALPLGDLPSGSAAVDEDEAGPLDDLLSQVTDLLSQMHELCQDEDE